MSLRLCTPRRMGRRKHLGGLGSALRVLLLAVVVLLLCSSGLSSALLETETAVTPPPPQFPRVAFEFQLSSNQSTTNGGLPPREGTSFLPRWHALFSRTSREQLPQVIATVYTPRHPADPPSTPPLIGPVHPAASEMAEEKLAKTLRRLLPNQYGCKTLQRQTHTEIVGEGNQSASPSSSVAAKAAPIHMVRLVSPRSGITGDSGSGAAAAARLASADGLLAELSPALNGTPIVIPESEMLNGSITLEGNGIMMIEIPVKRGSRLNTVAELKMHSADHPLVPVDNCRGYSIAVDLRSASANDTSNDDDDPSSVSSTSHDGFLSTYEDEVEEELQSTENSFWNALASVMDRSMLCRATFSISLRAPVSYTEDLRTFYLVFTHKRYRVYSESKENPPQCQLNVFLSQSNERTQTALRRSFVLFLPILILVLPQPFFLRHAHDVITRFSEHELDGFLVSQVLWLHQAIVRLAKLVYRQARQALRQHRMQRRNRRRQESTSPSPLRSPRDERVVIIPVDQMDSVSPESREEAVERPEKEIETLSPKELQSVGGEGKQDDEERVCRICRDDGEREDLIAPCKCTGSVRWVHASCLNRWRIECLTRNQTNVDHCEICRNTFDVPIKRGNVLERVKGFCNNLLFFILTMLLWVVYSVGIRETLGNLSCATPYHQVDRTITFSVDGAIVTLTFYLMLMLGLSLAKSIVFSWFRHREVVVNHLEEVGVLLPFGTWRNYALVAVVLIVLVLQSVALGYLFKYLLFTCSTIPWNWEISPLIGSLLLLLWYCRSFSFQQSLHQRWEAARFEALRHRPPVSTAEVGPAVRPGAVGTAVGTSAAAAAEQGRNEEPSTVEVLQHFLRLHGPRSFDGSSWIGGAHNSGIASAVSPEVQADYTSQFEVPADQRIIRAYEYCPPTRKTAARSALV